MNQFAYHERHQVFRIWNTVANAGSLKAYSIQCIYRGCQARTLDTRLTSFDHRSQAAMSALSTWIGGKKSPAHKSLSLHVVLLAQDNGKLVKVIFPSTLSWNGMFLFYNIYVNRKLQVPGGKRIKSSSKIIRKCESVESTIVSEQH